MIRRRAALWCIAVAAAMSFGASPAGARPANDASGLRVSVGAHWEPVSETICETTLSYRQRIVVDGQSAMMLVPFVVAPGHYDNGVLYGSCDGYTVYAFGDCQCQYAFMRD